MLRRQQPARHLLKPRVVVCGGGGGFWSPGCCFKSRRSGGQSALLGDVGRWCAWVACLHLGSTVPSSLPFRSSPCCPLSAWITATEREGHGPGASPHLD